VRFVRRSKEMHVSWDRICEETSDKSMDPISTVGSQEHHVWIGSEGGSVGIFIMYTKDRSMSLTWKIGDLQECFMLPSGREEDGSPTPLKQGARSRSPADPVASESCLGHIEMIPCMILEFIHMIG
jgi:hypothetical protein